MPFDSLPLAQGRCRRFGAVVAILAGLATNVPPIAAPFDSLLLAQGRQLPATIFAVVYDHLDSKLERAVAGTLEIDAEFVRFQARHQQIAWAIPLVSIESITLEDTLTPAKMRIRCVIIASRPPSLAADHQASYGEARALLIRYRIVPVDDELRFVSPAVLSGVMREHWKRVTSPRARMTAREQ